MKQNGDPEMHSGLLLKKFALPAFKPAGTVRGRMHRSRGTH
jgi:hypothetical protein